MALLSTRFPRWAPCRRGAALLAAALLFLSQRDASAQPAVPREYQIKAVFLFNFAQFVEWPGPAFADAQAPLVIGVLGDNPFEAFLQDTVRGETVNGHPLLVQHYRRVEEIATCHILFVAASEADRLGPILTYLKNHPILTVGDSEGFTKTGGIIRFLTEKNKVRLRINVEAAKAAGLAISSKLLRPAEIVTAEN